MQCKKRQPQFSEDFCVSVQSVKHPGTSETFCPKESKLQREKSKTEKLDSLNAATISLVLNTSITLSDERLNIQVFSMLILCKFFCIFSSAKCLNFNYILAFEA